MPFTLSKCTDKIDLNGNQLLVGDWMRLIPFGVTVGGLSYLSLKGLANTPVVGPYIQVKISWPFGQTSY